MNQEDKRFIGDIRKLLENYSRLGMDGSVGCKVVYFTLEKGYYLLSDEGLNKEYYPIYENQFYIRLIQIIGEYRDVNLGVSEGLYRSIVNRLRKMDKVV